MKIMTTFDCDYESLDIDALVRREEGRPVVIKMKALFRGKVDVTQTLTMTELLKIEERVISFFMEDEHERKDAKDLFVDIAGRSE